MTQPTGEPKKWDEKSLRSFLERGATTTIETVETFLGSVREIHIPAGQVVEFAQTGDLAKRAAAQGLAVHMLIDIDFQKIPDFGIWIFLNTPAADGNTPTTSAGFLSSIAFFTHHPGRERFLLPATDVLNAVGDADAATATFVPVMRGTVKPTEQTLPITVSLDLIRSKVS